MTQLDNSDEIDPFVQEQVPYTNGFLYRPLQYKLSRYPIPELRLEPGEGTRFLDIGCNWGRWSIAAARKGYRVSAIDPSPPAVIAASMHFGCGRGESASPSEAGQAFGETIQRVISCEDVPYWGE